MLLAIPCPRDPNTPRAAQVPSLSLAKSYPIKLAASDFLTESILTHLSIYFKHPILCTFLFFRILENHDFLRKM